MKLSILPTAIAAVLLHSPTLHAGPPASLAAASTSCESCPSNNCHCANGCTSGGHDYFTHAPIGVMGDHIHHQGGLMASYRYMFMSMQRNYDGDSRISDTAARISNGGYMMAPTDMDMQMHMLGVMYAPTDKLTLMLMAHHLENDMSMVNMMGTTSKMHTSGWGDVTLTANYSLFADGDSSAHIGLGLSVPTGSIDEAMPSGAHMAYPMQLGSGTWDLKPSITWLKHNTHWAFGTQASATIRLGENDNGYSLGDSLTVTSWVSRKLNSWSSVSFRLTASTWGDVDGMDDKTALIPMGPLAGNPMSSTADPDAHGGSRINAALGLNLWSSEHGARFGIEAGAPIYQNLNGPQLGSEWFLTLGLQVAW